jgi:hypothetical protein
MRVVFILLVFSLCSFTVFVDEQTLSNTPSNEYGRLKMTPTRTGIGTPHERVGMKFEFEPTDKVNCDKIVFAQTVKIFFIDDDSKETVSKPGDIYESWKYRDKYTLEDGTFIDPIATEKDPYVNGDDRTEDGRPKEDHGDQGRRNSEGSSSATWKDSPLMPADYFPADKNKVRMEFEICAMCAGGEQAGTVYGCATWEYTQTKGQQDGSSSSTTGDNLNDPSSIWRYALDLAEHYKINEEGERQCAEEN